MSIADLPADWLSSMPFIPLARGVPMVQLHVAGPPVTRGWVALGPDTCTLPSDDPSCTFLGNANSIDRGFMRVDLNDAGGFAYALRHLMTQYSHRGKQCPIGPELIRRSLHTNASTDADRLALAKALAEVTP
jgi:hypothetical protein